MGVSWQTQASCFQSYFQSYFSLCPRTPGDKKLPEGQQELSVSTILNEVQESFWTPFLLPFLFSFPSLCLKNCLFTYLLIWLCWVLVAICGIFNLPCSWWDLLPWPRMEPGPPALEVQSFSYWTTREVPSFMLLMSPMLQVICSILGNQR